MVAAVVAGTRSLLFKHAPISLSRTDKAVPENMVEPNLF
jgi:hypothetical protein